MLNKLSFRVVAAVVVVVVLVIAWMLLAGHESSASRQQTDDAYVQADATLVAPQVDGVIARLLVEDNQRVTAGQPLVDIDDRDLRIAVATAKANVESLQAQIVRQGSVLDQARVAVDASQASLALAAANRQRFANLAKDGSGTEQASQQASTEWAVQRAALAGNEAGVRSVGQQTRILEAELARAQASLEDAELKLSYAHITAPVSGVVTQRRARLGGYAHVGEPLLAVVPLESVYVDASYRETQLSRVRVGQPVTVTVDALPGVTLKGEVESLAPASGMSFAGVQAHNATGNFTKIVQRLPIRIRLLPGQPEVARLRVGMSAQPVIDVSKLDGAVVAR